MLKKIIGKINSDECMCSGVLKEPAIILEQRCNMFFGDMVALKEEEDRISKAIGKDVIILKFGLGRL